MSLSIGARRVGSAAYINGNGTAPTAIDGEARSESFYGKVLQLHREVVAGKHPRLTFSQTSTAPVPAPVLHGANTSSITTAAHLQTDSSQHLPGLYNHSVQLSEAPATSSATLPASAASLAAPKFNPVLLEKSSSLRDAEDKLRIKKNRDRLEKIIADQGKADDEIPRRGAVDIPLNLLALAHARVPPVSGLKRDSSVDSFDENSYYSSKANSWSTENSEVQLGHDDSAIIISDGEDDELYEPPMQMGLSMGRLAQVKASGIHDPATPLSDGQWEPEWDEEEDYEPPAPSTFNNTPSFRAVPQVSSHKIGSQISTHGQMQQYPPHMQVQQRGQRSGPIPASPLNIAHNQIATPVAPQPSRISPLTTGNVTRTMQSQMNTIQQVPPLHKQNDKRRAGNHEHLVHVGPNKKEQRKAAKQLAKKEREESKKRKRGAVTPDRGSKRGKRNAATVQDASPEPYIKPEPTSPVPGLAAIPSRRPSVVYRDHQEPPVLSSPYRTRPRSAYNSDHEQAPVEYRYGSAQADRVAMPPPSVHRPAHRDTSDLRRVASLQHARRPLTPGRDYSSYADPRAPAPRYEQYERPSSRGLAQREGSARPPISRVMREASPPRPISSYGRNQPPAVGQIVEDAYGNRYVAELIPDDYPLPARRFADDYAESQNTPSRLMEGSPHDAYKMGPPASRSRAYSHAPEPIPVERHSRAYSRVPEAVLPPPIRAYSVVPQNMARGPVHRSEYDGEPVYGRRPRYEDATPLRTAYPPEYPPRPYSVHPEAVARAPEYSTRAGSMAPSGGYARREVATSALPVVSSREYVQPEQEYTYPTYETAPPVVRQYDDRRVVSHRY